MKIKFLCVLIVCVLPVVSMAGPRKCDDKKSEQKPRDNRPWRGDASADEMDAALKLYQEHSKRRWEEYSKLDAEQKKKVANSMLGTYRMLRFFTRNRENLALWENKVEQIQIEDDIFGYRLDLAKGDAVDAARIKEQIRNKVAALVDKRMQERSMRIASLQKSLKDETEKFVQDVNNREAVIDEMFTRELAKPAAIINEKPKQAGEREGEPDKPDKCQ